MKSLRCILANIIILLLMQSSSSAQPKTAEPTDLDLFITPHFRIYSEEGISKDLVHKFADDIELIFNTFQSHIKMPMQKNLVVKFYSKYGAVGKKFNGPAVMMTGISKDTIFVQYWGAGNPQLEEFTMNSLRFLIPYSTMMQMSLQGVPSWLVRGYILWYMNAPAGDPPVATFIRSFDDFSEEGVFLSNPSQESDYDFLLTKTVDYLVKKYSEQNFLLIFSTFDPDKSIKEVFEKVFAEKYNVIEKGWRVFIDSQLGKNPKKNK